MVVSTPEFRFDENSPRYHRSKSKGDAAEAIACAIFVLAGFDVSKPLSENCPYDLVVDDGRRLARVQVKWARVENGFACFRTCSTLDGTHRCYRSDEVDFFAAYAGELGKLYLLPHALVGAQKLVQLRLEAPRNGQRHKIRWAADHEFAGALPWIEESAPSGYEQAL